MTGVSFLAYNFFFVIFSRLQENDCKMTDKNNMFSVIIILTLFLVRVNSSLLFSFYYYYYF